MPNWACSKESEQALLFNQCHLMYYSWCYIYNHFMAKTYSNDAIITIDLCL
jgi:hypothetical protein